MKAMPSFVRAATARPRPAGIPQEFLLRDLKEKRKFRLLSRKLSVFVTFVAIYLAALLLDRNISGRMSCFLCSVVQSIVATELLTTPRGTSQTAYNSIASVSDFWDWFANSLLSIMYSGSDGVEAYTLATHTVIVGGFHVLQTRYRALNFSDPANADDHCYSDMASLQNQTCYSTTADSTEAFGVTNGSNTSVAELQSLEMFAYSTDNDSALAGYQTLFLRSSTDGTAEFLRVDLMRQYRWIDRQTKQVAITMPLYNYNLRIWSIVYLTVDFNLAGGIEPTSSILVTNLEPYDFNVRINVVRSVLEAIFVAHVVYFAVLEVWDVCVLSGGNLKVVGLLSRCFSIGLTDFVLKLNHLPPSTRQKMLALTSFDEYVNALPLMIWDRVLLGLNLLNILLLTGRALKYFQVTKGGRRLMRSVYGAMPEVMSFLPIYFSIIVGYSFAGHMLFGLSSPEWSTFPRAFFRVFELNFGLYDPGPIYDQGGIFSAIFIYSSTIVFCILMLNVFMAIVMSTWERLSEKEADRASERDQFSRELGFTDALFLMAMKEDQVDALIDVALNLEGVELVTRSTFVKAWDDVDDLDTPEWTVSRVLGWYWDRDDAAATASGFNASTKALAAFGSSVAISKAISKFNAASSGATANANASNPSLKKYVGRIPAMKSEDEEDEPVEVINSARDLDTKPGEALQGKTSSGSTGMTAFAIPMIPWTLKPAVNSAKVTADG
ncbi:hypothetical protein BBJ28_00000168 [Nothophytophthora sp. Chile5]|nr:hypothetical protein BBJ28_00000168 [Nothophytophthora sp. Chile5]